MKCRLSSSKKSAFLPAVQMSCGPGRSAIISGEVHEFISSPCSMNARAGYSGKINIQICITGRGGKGKCAAAICTTRRLTSFMRDSTPVSPVRRTLISQNRMSSSTKCTCGNAITRVYVKREGITQRSILQRVTLMRTKR